MLARIINGVIGGFMLFGFNLNGMNRLEFSTQAFIRSFGAALLILPLQILLMSAEYAGAQSDLRVTGVALTALQLAFYALSWVVYPLLLIPIAKLLNHSPRYVPYVISYNWTSIANYLLTVPAAALFAYTGSTGALFVVGTIGIWTLAVRIWLLRKVMGTDWPQAIALLIIDGTIALMLTSMLASIALNDLPASTPAG